MKVTLSLFLNDFVTLWPATLCVCACVCVCVCVCGGGGVKTTMTCFSLRCFTFIWFLSLPRRLLRPQSGGAGVTSDTASITVQTHFFAFSNSKRRSSHLAAVAAVTPAMLAS